MFEKYIEILVDMVSDSECGKFELTERALTSQQPFRDDVLRLIEKA